MKYVVFFNLLFFIFAYAYHTETLQEHDDRWKQRLRDSEQQAREEGIALGEITCLENCADQNKAAENSGYKRGKIEAAQIYEARIAELEQQLSRQAKTQQEKLSRLATKHTAELRDTVTALTGLHEQELGQKQEELHALTTKVQHYQRQIQEVATRYSPRPSLRQKSIFVSSCIIIIFLPLLVRKATFIRAG